MMDSGFVMARRAFVTIATVMKTCAWVVLYELHPFVSLFHYFVSY